MKTLTTTLLLFTITAIYAGSPDEAKSSFGKNFLNIWENSTNHAIDVAEAMPENLYSFKPSDSSMTFAEQMIHIGLTTQNLAKGFILGEKGDWNAPDAATMSKAEVIEFMKKGFSLAAEAITGITEDQANEIITVFGGKEVPRYIGVMFIQDHLANHRAKANLYIRINDIKPPAYKFF